MAQKLEAIPLGPGKELSGTTYTSFAENFMKQRDQKFKFLTTSKLRGIYSLVVNLTGKINEDNFTDNLGELQYLKVKMAYECGRNQDVRAFIDTTGLMALIDRIKTHGQFLTYCRYAESLVAYFKYYGGKD